MKTCPCCYGLGTIPFIDCLAKQTPCERTLCSNCLGEGKVNNPYFIPRDSQGFLASPIPTNIHGH
jgi:hypothetical protein